MSVRFDPSNSGIRTKTGGDDLLSGVKLGQLGHKRILIDEDHVAGVSDVSGLEQCENCRKA